MFARPWTRAFAHSPSLPPNTHAAATEALEADDKLTPEQKAAVKRKMDDENKTWLQKNWIMLIPAAFIVSFFWGGGVHLELFFPGKGKRQGWGVVGVRARALPYGTSRLTELPWAAVPCWRSQNPGHAFA